MNINPRAKFELAAAVVALGLAIVLFRVWLQEHDDRLALAATLQAQNQVIAQADVNIKQRAADLQKSLADYEKLRHEKPSTQQMVREIPKYIDTPLPKAIEEPLPNAPGVTIPAEDVAMLRDTLIHCKETALQFDGCKKDAIDTAVKIDALAKERDAAVHAVKGGTKFQRFKRALRWIAIGAAAGAAATAVARH